SPARRTPRRARPTIPRRRVDDDGVVTGCLEGHAAGRDARHESRKTGIDKDHVAAATQDVQRQGATAGELHGVPYVLLRGAIAEEACGTSEADRRVWREANRLSYQHYFRR